MSITASAKTRSTRAKIALVPVLSLGLLGGSVALAAPAQANDGSIREWKTSEVLRGVNVH
jgi:hypothetical protein